MVIGTAASHQFGVRSLLGDPAFVEHDDLIGVLYRAKPVGDNDNSLATKKGFEVLHNFPLIIGIQGIGRLVEENVIGIAVRCAGDQDTLFLTGAQSVTVCTDAGIVA